MNTIKKNIFSPICDFLNEHRQNTEIDARGLIE